MSRAFYSVAQLGIPDLLRDRSRSSDELVQATGTHAPSLCGVFAEDDYRRFVLTPVATRHHSNRDGDEFARGIAGMTQRTAAASGCH
jgi:hypothetical protein